MIWSYTNLPPKPFRLFLIEADYNKHRKCHPKYEIVASNKTNAKKFFKEVYPWLKIVNIEEVDNDYQPNKWYIQKYKNRRDFKI